MNLDSVDEQLELPPDPKIRVYGRAPARQIRVRQEYTTDPTSILNDLAEFVFKNAKLMDFNDEKPDYWKTILSAILSSQSYEHKVFKSNLDILIKENIAETGVDPRIDGPPSHIATQVV